MTFRATVLTLYPEMFPGPLGVEPGRAGAGGGHLEPRGAQHPRLRDRQASHRRRHAGGRRGGDGAAAGRARRRARQRRRRAPDAGDDAARDAADAGARPRAGGRDGRHPACGRFEGFDERIFEARPSNPSRSATMSCRAASLARWSMLDACVRLLPGVMGAASSGEEESFETGASRISALYPTC